MGANVPAIAILMMMSHHQTKSTSQSKLTMHDCA